jgi:hypothetical protein
VASRCLQLLPELLPASLALPSRLHLHLLLLLLRRRLRHWFLTPWLCCCNCCM